MTPDYQDNNLERKYHGFRKCIKRISGKTAKIGGVKRKCYVCGVKKPANQMNGIYSSLGFRAYCKKKECQKRFIEDAGDPNYFEQEQSLTQSIDGK